MAAEPPAESGDDESCDPAKLANDVANLAKAYEPAKLVKPFDAADVAKVLDVAKQASDVAKLVKPFDAADLAKVLDVAKQASDVAKLVKPFDAADLAKVLDVANRFPDFSAVLDGLKSTVTPKSFFEPRSQPRTGMRKGRSSRAFLESKASVVDDLKTFARVVADVMARHGEHGLLWRGQADIDWPVRSSLARRLAGNQACIDEDHLIEAETNLLYQAQRSGLRKLSKPPWLNVLAVLQHAGVPTRLLDVSRDPWIASWFAVSDESDRDAVVLAWGEVPRKSPKEVAPMARDLDWLNPSVLPWHSWTVDERRSMGWGTGARTYSWFPSVPNLRMRVQRGGFLFDAGPDLTDQIADLVSEHLEQDWRKEELQRAVSVFGLPSPLNRKTKKNDAFLVPLFVIVIKATLKGQVLKHLAQLGINHQTMYPDLPGFAAYINAQPLR